MSVMKYDADNDIAALLHLHGILLDIMSNLNEIETSNQIWAMIYAECSILDRLSRYFTDAESAHKKEEAAQ